MSVNDGGEETQEQGKLEIVEVRPRVCTQGVDMRYKPSLEGNAFCITWTPRH
jgi:hypothetical protein